MFFLFVRYHFRPAIRRFLARITAVSVLSAAVFAFVVPYAYVQFFREVLYGGLLPVTTSQSMVRASTFLFVVGFLIAGMRKRHGLVTFCSLTPLEPGNALRLLLLSSAGRPFRWGVIYLAAVLPVFVRLSPSLERAVLHVASNAVAVVLHYLAAALIAVIWHRRRKGGMYVAVGFTAFVGAELLVYRQWPQADVVLVAVNIAACVACWTVVIGRLHAVHLQRFLVSAIPSRGGRSVLTRLLRPLPVETKLYVREWLLRREHVFAFLIAAALFGYLAVALILGIPDQQRAPTVIVCAYGAAVFAGTPFVSLDPNLLSFVKMTPVRFGRLTVSMLGSHCLGYLVAAAIVGTMGVLNGMRLDVLPILLSQGIFVSLAAWLVTFRFFFVARILAHVFTGLVVSVGLTLALAAASLEGAAWPLAYAAFVVATPSILCGGASRRYQDVTIEDWAAPS